MATRRTSGILLMALLLPCVAGAQVDCSDPDNLCTGDPCVIPSLTVASPCVADFGTRAVVVAGTLRVPSEGSVSLTAGTITVDGKISANQSSSDGGHVTLDAAADVLVNGPILTMGSDLSGDITILAGGDVVLLAPLKASANAFADPGAVTIEAGGVVHVGKPIVSKGGNYADGGTVSVSGDDGVVIEKPINTSAGRGLNAGTGGDVAITSTAGTVTIDTKLTTRGADAGNVTVVAASTLIMDGNIKVDDSACSDCVGAAGVVTLTSTAGDVDVTGTVSATAILLFTPTIMIDAAGEALVSGKIKAPFRGDFGNAGTIVLSGDVVAIEAPANVNAASPDAGGIIRVIGGSVVVGAGTVLDAHGADEGMGEVRIRALTGNATLSGKVVSGGGDGTYPGIIEAAASGNLTADGEFMCGPNGCIGMSAGATLDTSAGAFDGPVVADCPGSPSGAFVD